MALLLVLVLCSIATYVIWRRRFFLKTWEELKGSLPPENQLSWRLPSQHNYAPATFSRQVNERSENETPDPDNNSSRPIEAGPGPFEQLHQEMPNWAPLADGFIAGIPAADHLLHLDPAVLKAIEFSTADHIHNIASINSYVNEHFFSVPHASAEGWLHRLEGYVAEQKAATVLETHGHHVQFAHTANQPAWDLKVDGHPLQIKEGVSSAETTAHHLAHHPSIPVLTGSNTADHLHNPLVHGTHALDPSLISGVTKDTLSNLHDGFGLHFHVPVVTVALSSWREIRLLISEKKSIEEAVVDAVTDVGLTGLGIMGGAKIGAIAGSPLGVPGAAVGTIAGAMAGGFLGKNKATEIRHKNLNAAWAEYQQQLENANSEVQTAVDRSRNDVEAARDIYEAKDQEIKRAVGAAAVNQLGQISDRYAADLSKFATSFPRYLDLMLQQLDQDQKGILARVPEPGWRSILIPDQGSAWRYAVNRWYFAARKKIERVQKECRSLWESNPEKLYAWIRWFLGAYVFSLDQMTHDLEMLGDSYAAAMAEAQAARQRAIQDVEKNHQSLLQELGKRISEIHGQVCQTITRWASVVEQVKKNLRREAEKVGVTLPM